MLSIKNLSKHYGRKHVLDDVNIMVEKGQVTGLLGPSGSGKTTLMRIISGLIPAKQGDILIDGEKPSVRTKAVTSLLTETNAIPKWMTIKDVIEFYDEMYPDFSKEKFDEILESIELDIQYSQKVKSLSKGMQQMLRLALTLSRKAKLYLLDEPLGGMDTLVRENVIRILLEHMDTDSCMLITTHLISEIEKILEKVIFINNGKILGTYDCEQLRIEKGQSVEKTYKEVFKHEKLA